MGRYYKRSGEGDTVKVINVGGSTPIPGVPYVKGPASVNIPQPFGSGNVITFINDGSFVVPEGVTEIRAACIGAGGDGRIDSQAGGGAGGGFAIRHYYVNEGDNIDFTIVNGKATFDSSGLIQTIFGDKGEVGLIDALNAGGTFSAPGGVGYVGGNTIGDAGGGKISGGGGNGMCSWIAKGKPIPTALPVSPRKQGTGIFFLNNDSGVNDNLKSDQVFISYTPWSPMDENFYNDSVSNQAPGKGGVTTSSAGSDGGFLAGGAGKPSTGTVSSGDGGIGGGGGAAASGISSSRTVGGDAMIIIEY